jgi:hypothetical protein
MPPVKFFVVTLITLRIKVSDKIVAIAITATTVSIQRHLTPEQMQNKELTELLRDRDRRWCDMCEKVRKLERLYIDCKLKEDIR